MRKHRRLSYVLGWAPASGHTLGVACTAFQSDGSVITGGRDGTVRIWRGGELVETREDHADAVNDVVVCPVQSATSNSCSFVSASSDSLILFYSPTMSISESHLHRDGVKKVGFTPDGLELSSIGLDGMMYHYSLASGLATTGKIDCGCALFSLASHTTSPQVDFAGSATGHIFRVDWRERVATAAGAATAPTVKDAHKGAVRDILALDGGLELVSCSTNGAIKVWDVRHMRSSVICHLHSDAIFSLALAGPNIVLSGSRDGTVVATNLSTMESSKIVVSQYPIFHVNVSPRNVLYTCTPRSTVDAYVMSSILPTDFLMRDDSVTGSAGCGSCDGDLITPSKVSLVLGSSSVASALVTTDGRNYTSTQIAPVEFTSKEQQERWCTSFASAHSSLNITPTEPDFSLPGGNPALLRCTLLGDKAHVICMDENDSLSVWSLLDCKKKLTFPAGTTMKAACEQCDLGLTVQSWCSVECRWGSICVTLSHDDAYSAYMNAWEWDLIGKLGKCTVKTAQSSTYSMSRAERTTSKEKPLINLGVTAVKRVFAACKGSAGSETAEDPSCVMQIVVWPVRLSPGEQENLDLPPPTKCNLRTVTLSEVLTSVPSWIASTLSVGAAPPPASGAVVSVEVIPSPTTSLAAVPKPIFQVPRTLVVADLIVEIARQLKINNKLPSLASVAEAVRQKSKGTFVISPGDDPVAAGPAKPEEYVELVAFDDTVVEPLLSVGAASFIYKEKNKGTLRLWYRKNHFCSSSSS